MASGTIEATPLMKITTQSYQSSTVKVTRIGNIRIIRISGSYSKFSYRDSSFTLAAKDRPSETITTPVTSMAGNVYTKAGHLHIGTDGSIYGEGFPYYNNSTNGQVQFSNSDNIHGCLFVYTV